MPHSPSSGRKRGGVEVNSTARWPQRPDPDDDRDTPSLPNATALPEIRVGIVNAHPATRIGLESILSAAGMNLAMSCATVSEAFTRIASARCDTLLLGSPADSSASAAVARLAGSRVPIVVIGPDPVAPLLRSGAAGAIGLEAEPARIVAALQAAAAGLVVAEVGVLVIAAESAEADDTQLENLAAPAGGATAAPLEALSAREIELLRHLAEGYTNKEIARAMVLAEDTVKKAVQSLIAKLRATDRTHAVVLALRQGVIV